MIAVVATSIANAEVARYLLPNTPMRARAADRVYFVYDVKDGNDVVFDGLDGQPLIEVHNFDTLPEAHAWVTADARLRHLVAGGRN